MLMTGGEEVALESFRLVVTDRVGRVLGVPVVPSSGVHGAVGPDRTVLVVRMAIWGSPTVAMARATASSGHLGGKRRVTQILSKSLSFRIRRIGPSGTWMERATLNNSGTKGSSGQIKEILVGCVVV